MVRHRKTEGKPGSPVVTNSHLNRKTSPEIAVLDHRESQVRTKGDVDVAVSNNRACHGKYVDIGRQPPLPDAGIQRCICLESDAEDTHVLERPAVRGVTGLKITPVNRDGTKNVSAANHFNPPVGIEIELSLMADEATAREWADMPKSTTEQKAASNNFRNKNEYTFRRTVWLGDRTFQ